VSGLSIKDGVEVECGGRRFIIMQRVGFDFVVASDVETDDLVRLAVVDLYPVSLAPSTVPSLPDLSKVDDRDWAEARRRLDLESLPPDTPPGSDFLSSLKQDLAVNSSIAADDVEQLRQLQLGHA
jgi:hypothetical protein